MDLIKAFYICIWSFIIHYYYDIYFLPSDLKTYHKLPFSLERNANFKQSSNGREKLYQFFHLFRIVVRILMLDFCMLIARAFWSTLRSAVGGPRCSVCAGGRGRAGTRAPGCRALLPPLSTAAWAVVTKLCSCMKRYSFMFSRSWLCPVSLWKFLATDLAGLFRGVVLNDN